MQKTLKKNEWIGGFSTRLYATLTFFVHVMYEILEPSVIFQWVDVWT